MRKVILPILLATCVATPALARADDYADRQAARAEQQQQARAERQQAREERAATNAQRQQAAANERAQQRPPQASLAGVSQAQANAPARVRADASADRRDIAAIRAARQQQQDSRVDQRDARQAERAQHQERTADQRRDNIANQQTQQHWRAPVVSSTPRPGTQPPPRTGTRPTTAPNWSTNWRNNNHYDWQNHRRHHRSWFHLGFYYDPFGWNYQRYDIGWRIWPSYYGSRYWINDPYQYRLPYAPPGYRWVRYYDDAILVDTWTGEVVDVIYNFFW